MLRLLYSNPHLPHLAQAILRDAGYQAGAWMFIPKGEFAIEHLLNALNQLGMMPRKLS